MMLIDLPNDFYIAKFTNKQDYNMALLKRAVDDRRSLSARATLEA